MSQVQILSTLQNKEAQKKAVFRSSSAVFIAIYNQENKIDTEVSLLNHFILKRGITDVVATFELRSLEGDLIKNFKINMDKERAYAVRISEYLSNNFVGSIYVFFKSNDNLAVPFCAVVCSIKSSNSVCGVHAYGRRLEQKELGSNLDIQNTIETGWTVRDTNLVKSFTVLHGGEFKLKLSIRVEVVNSREESISINKEFTLNPFGTLLLILQDLSDELIQHLEGQKGHAKIFIEGLRGIFPRMLCGNFSFSQEGKKQLLNANEIQFTHTNFDFSSIGQPDAGGDYGYINQPSLPGGYGIVYPVNTNKAITVNNELYASNTLHHIDLEPLSQVQVRAENSKLPSRLVAAAVGTWKDAILESECSTGTFIEDYLKVPCHWHWGLLKPGFDNGESEISIMLNKFNRNSNLSRVLNLRLFNEERLLVNQDMVIDGHMKLNAMDILPRKLPDGAIWYVLSGNNLEDLFIYSTFYPDGKAGFVEHAF